MPLGKGQLGDRALPLPFDHYEVMRCGEWRTVMIVAIQANLSTLVAGQDVACKPTHFLYDCSIYTNVLDRSKHTIKKPASPVKMNLLIDKVVPRHQPALKHFVILSGLQKTKEPLAPTPILFSGFVIEFEGTWYYVTAGHVIDDIKSAIKHGGEFFSWSFDDSMAEKRFLGYAIPYDFNLKNWIFLRDAYHGVDYAGVALDGITRLNLIAGGAIAITSDIWGSHLSYSDEWMIAGIPCETYKPNPLEPGRIRVFYQCYTASLEKCEPPKEAENKSQNQIYAKFLGDHEEHFQSVEGMSGGPIFSLHKEGEDWKHVLIGIQSAWYPTYKILAIYPIQGLIDKIKEVNNS